MANLAEYFLSEVSELLSSRTDRLIELLDEDDEKWLEPSADPDLESESNAVEGLLFLIGFHEFKLAINYWEQFIPAFIEEFGELVEAFEKIVDILIAKRPIRMIAAEYAEFITGSSGDSKWPPGMFDLSEMTVEERTNRSVELLRLAVVADAAIEADSVCYDPGWDEISAACEDGLQRYGNLLPMLVYSVGPDGIRGYPAREPRAGLPYFWLSRTPRCERLIELDPNSD